jgi:hypothetical protein
MAEPVAVEAAVPNEEPTRDVAARLRADAPARRGLPRAAIQAVVALFIAVMLALMVLVVVPALLKNATPARAAEPSSSVSVPVQPSASR